jgi:hypothetical protein
VGDVRCQVLSAASSRAPCLRRTGSASGIRKNDGDGDGNGNGRRELEGNVPCDNDDVWSFGHAAGFEVAQAFVPGEHNGGRPRATGA